MRRQVFVRKENGFELATIEDGVIISYSKLDCKTQEKVKRHYAQRNGVA